MKEQKIKIEEGDAPEFIHMVNTIMETMVFQYSIKEIVFVKIKNWFDHKWLNYSGKTVVPFDFGDLLKGMLHLKTSGETKFQFLHLTLNA